MIFSHFSFEAGILLTPPPFQHNPFSSGWLSLSMIAGLLPHLPTLSALYDVLVRSHDLSSFR